MIYIVGSELNLQHSALEVYVSGCTRDCPGCHNPEAQKFGKGMRWNKWLIANRFKLKTGTFKRIWILGGDLLCQPDLSEAQLVISDLRRNSPAGTELWLWTGASLQEVPKTFLASLDYIKAGRYVASLPQKEVVLSDDTKLILASENQEIHSCRR